MSEGLWTVNLQLEGGEFRKCVLRPRKDSWTFYLKDDIQFGVMSGESERFHTSCWVLISVDGIMEPRWIRYEKRDGPLKISAATALTFFKISPLHAIFDLKILYATIPDYMGSRTLPVAEPSKRPIIHLIRDLSVGEVLPIPREMIKFNHNISVILKAGDSWWHEFDLNGIVHRVPIRMENTEKEALITSFENVIISSENSASCCLPPSFISDPSPQVLDIIRVVTRMEGEKIFLFGLTGSCFVSKKTLLGNISRYLRYPLLNFQIDERKSPINHTIPTILYLQIHESSRFVYNFLRDLKNMECASPIYLFIFCTNGKIDEQISKLLSKTWDVPVLLSVSEEMAGLSIEACDSVKSLSEFEKISLEDSTKAIRKRIGWGRESAQVPKVKWEDIAGLEEAKALLLETIKAPLSQSHLIPTNLGQRRGILFHGPPGTGKTLLAKAIATEFNMSFISIKGPEILDMYVGESEAHVREAFTLAKKSAPCVLFFDELDSLAVTRGRSGDAGGVTDRIVSQLLTELDDLEFSIKSQVFIIGATNRPDLLDPALLRPGRFDKLVYLGLPKTKNEQAAILATTLKSYLVDADVDLSFVTENLSFEYSPADLASIAHTSMRLAMKRIIKRSTTQESDYAVSIGMEDILMASAMVPPSCHNL